MDHNKQEGGQRETCEADRVEAINLPSVTETEKKDDRR